MRDWHKAVLMDTLKAAVPAKQALRQALRRVRPYRTDPAMDRNLLNNAMRTIELLRAAGFDLRGRRVLEIGSGWHPILPMVYLAAGARSVVLTDIERLMDARLLRSAIALVQSARDEISARLGADDFDRLEVPDGTLAEMLNALGLEYLVPYRTAQSPDASVEVIVSVSVLEHIPPATLEAMLRDFRRIIAPGGAMVHLVDCSDHWAMRDHSLSRCNFLRYGDLTWRLLCLNPQAYHNRLRHSDLVGLLRAQGFRIAQEWRESRAKEQAEVRAMRLAPRFGGREVEDLAAISSHLVAVAPG